jgi:hypothetical protein
MGTDRSIYRTLSHSDDGLPVYTEQLEPGDRMLLHADGVTEGHAADGSRFGIDLLSDFVIRHSRSGTPAPEMLRRLTRTITEYQHGRLSDDATIVLIEWMPSPVRDHSLPPEVSGGQQSQPGQAGTKRKARLSLGTPADCRNLRGRRIAVAGTGRERDSGQAVALQTARTSRGPAGFTWRGAIHVRPHCPPAVRVQARQARSGVRVYELPAAYGEMTVAMRYLFQG